MEWWQSIVLGVVEGITEYLPVSSTGHLILAQRALGLRDDLASHAYAIVIQSGAILAVLSLYRDRARQAILGVLGGDARGRRLALQLMVAFLPAAVVGLLAGDWIDAHLFGLWPVVSAWAIGGVAILAVQGWYTRHSERAGADFESMDLSRAFCIGLFQCLALCPGTSRSLATILGGMVVGLSIPAAVEFSLLLGVVTLCAATGLKGVKDGSEMLAQYGWLNLLLGFATALVSAVIAVRWMVRYLERHGLAIFGYYRIALAVAVAAVLMAGAL